MTHMSPDDPEDRRSEDPDGDDRDLELRLQPDATAIGRAREIFAVIPEEAFRTDPEQFALYIESVFVDGDDLDDAVERFLSPDNEAPGPRGRSVRAVVPGEMLRPSALSPADLLEQLFLAFDEIEKALGEVLKRRTGRSEARSTPGRVIVPVGVIADPSELARAIDQLQSEAEKLELLVRQARNALRRLEPYRLSRRSPGRLVDEIRHANEMRTLQYLVEFLWSIRTAADSLEELELPRMHIRDYLTYLYQMEDWRAMSTLVRRLRHAVLAYTKDHSPAAAGAEEHIGTPEGDCGQGRSERTEKGSQLEVAYDHR